MGTDENGWMEFGRRLGIRVLAPAEIDLGGVKARFTALLPQFGGPAGMVVDADWSVIGPHSDALSASGYGYSCVGARKPENFDDAEATAAAREMLADWGWTSAAPKPAWLRD